MTKKELVREYAKKNRYFSLDEVVKSTGLGRQLAVKYLQQLKAEKAIFSAGRGLYTSVSEEFVYQKSSRVVKIGQLIKKEFPNLDFLIWNTLYFQPYYHHQQTHNITFIEVEYDGIHPVADKVSQFYRHVFVETKSKDYPPGFNITTDPVIVKRLIGRSPRNGNEPRMEKMLVDLYVIKDKYMTMPDADYWELWRAIYSLYRVNFSEVVDYALRRRNLKKLVSQLAGNTGIKEVIYGSKSSLLPRVTRNKKGSY